MAELDGESQLVILCGGRGRRLRPQTDLVPKALVPVAGRPIIDHVLDNYIKKGLDSVTLCVGYKGNQIRNHFENHPRNFKISFSDSGESASMLTRLMKVAPTLNQPAFVAYCDTFADLNLQNLIQSHRDRNALATIVTARIKSPFGITSIRADDFGPGGIITSFSEKPINDYFIGCFFIEYDAFKLVTEKETSMPDGEGLVALFDRLIDMKRLAAFQHEGLNITFNTEDERKDAESALQGFYTLREE